MFFVGDNVALNESAVGYPEKLFGKKLKVTAVEHYGVFVEGYDMLILASDVRVLWSERRQK